VPLMAHDLAGLLLMHACPFAARSKSWRIADSDATRSWLTPSGRVRRDFPVVIVETRSGDAHRQSAPPSLGLTYSLTGI
jgi:hypothetical protein